MSISDDRAVVATLLFRWLVGARRPAPAGTDPG